MDPVSSSPVPPQTQTQYWTVEENELFENALGEFDHVFPDLFEKIALLVPRKTIDQIKQHYEDLVHDVEIIEAGLVPLPNYDEEGSISILNSSSAHVVGGSNTNDHRQRRKPSPWTQEEHELFLEGLEKYGKGDWRSISRNCVKSKTPTQVASHAQKHFLRLERNMASTTSSSMRNSITSNLYQGAPPSTMPYANILAAAPPRSFISSNTDRGASLSTMPYANLAIAPPPSFRSLNTDQGASPSTMPYAILAAAPPPSFVSSNTDQGASPYTMPSSNLAAAPPSTMPYANILAAAPPRSFISSNTDRGASLSTMPYANLAIAQPPSFRSLNTDQGASPSTMPYAILAAAPQSSFVSSNTDQGASPYTMPSSNLAAAPPLSFMPEDTSAPLIASLPSFSHLSTIEEVNQLFASHSPSYDPKQ